MSVLLATMVVLAGCNSTDGTPTAKQWAPPETVNVTPIEMGNKSLGYSPATGMAAVRSADQLCVSQVRDPKGAKGTTPDCFSTRDELKQLVRATRFAAFSPTGAKVALWGHMGTTRPADYGLLIGDGSGGELTRIPAEAPDPTKRLDVAYVHWLDDNTLVAATQTSLVKLTLDGTMVTLGTWGEREFPIGLVGSGPMVAVLAGDTLRVVDALKEKPEPREFASPFKNVQRPTLLGVRSDGAVAITASSFFTATSGPTAIVLPDGKQQLVQADESVWTVGGGFSPDGQYLLLHLAESQGRMMSQDTRLALITVDGGESKELGKGPGKPYFGPWTWTQDNQVFCDPIWSLYAAGFSLTG